MSRPSTLRDDIEDAQLLLPLGGTKTASEWRQQRFFSRALHRAVADGNEKGVSDLLEQGGTAVIDHRDEIGLSPLHRAAIKGPACVVSMLCHAGADREATFEGLTGLHMACGRGHEDVVNVLLQGGANRDARTSQGFTALHCASGRGGLGCVKLLLEAGTDVNVRSEGRQQRTPLHAAAVLGDKTITVELLNWGATVDIPDTEGITSLHMAAAADNLEVALTLLRAGASTGAVQAGTLNTPLHLAAFQGARNVVLALLQAGAEVSMRNANRESPLHLACMMLDLAIVEILLSRGADETVLNSDDHTPYDVLGHGLEESAGSVAGGDDPETRDRIAAVLARAPAEKNWRRRSWLVMLRERAASVVTGPDLRGREGCGDGEEEGYRRRASFETSRTVVATDSARGDVGVEAGVMLCNEDGSGSSSADETLAAYVSWIVRLQEEGIFRHAAAFI